MNPLYLLSMDVDAASIGFSPPKGEKRARERADALQLYSYRAGSGQRVCIRPALPEAMQTLDSYLLCLGCPSEVVEAIVQKFSTIRDLKHDGTLTIAANVWGDLCMEIILIEFSSHITRIVMTFDDE